MKHYVTFEQAHTHRVQGNTLDWQTVAVYEAESSKEGRKKAFDLFGDKFFTNYHGDEWNEEGQLQYFPRGYVYLK